ncbi:MAG: TonB-dependent receptor [Bacteroidales bacterium]|nr:TonB-dependent receptor [Bacteroidales bacterium]MBR4408837.1 TonB-dependent receptor [Bacteroidales bacterium]
MRKLLSFILLVLPLCAKAQPVTLSGSVTEKGDGGAVEYATVLVVETGQWALTDEKGNYSILNIPAGSRTISVSCLGYATYEKEIQLESDNLKYDVRLDRDNLALEGVVVTAQSNEGSAATSRFIDKSALNHIQVLNVSDISGLLPGGVTSDKSLTSTQRFEVRSGGASEMGNSSFATAVEVDGVRLSNNASFTETKGVATNNIASSNVESVEVISGVPSAEYGDVGSGIVKINTRSGATPYTVTMSTTPNTKQLSVSKGFDFGHSRKGKSLGVLNVSGEYTNSISDLRSPYTSYKRKQLSLNYSNLFDKGIFSASPLRVKLGLSGNLGGRDTESDPDNVLDNFEKTRDNSFRAGFNAMWLLSKPWVTNLELDASAVYSDKQSRVKSDYTKTSSTVSIHGTEAGYFRATPYSDDPDAAVLLIPQGFWYNVMRTDDRPLTLKAGLKANLARNFGKVSSNTRLGVSWNADKNFGSGLTSEDESTAPTYRKYNYGKEVPFMHNIAAFAEENLTLPFGKTSLNVIAGLRAESTSIKDSGYGTVTSLSPRFNARYRILQGKDRKERLLRSLSIRGGWGVTMKQPSFAILFPTPLYSDIRVFVAPANSSGYDYEAYYIMPVPMLFNPDLVMQKNRQAEIGVDANVAGNRISVAAFWNRTKDSYYMADRYDSFSYKYTNQEAVNTVSIPNDNRIYSIGQDGVITVSDRTGALPDELAPYKERTRLIRRDMPMNASSDIDRYGLEWIIDFAEIKPVNTTIRVDGTFYGYKYVSGDIAQYSALNATMYDGSPMRLVGYYYGTSDNSNGRVTKNINTNLTITTHIPKIRMIFSLKLESSLMKYSRNLSEMEGGVRTYPAAGMNDKFPTEGLSIYADRCYALTYPLYYTDARDGVMIPFFEKYAWAKENDPELFSELTNLVRSSSYLYYYQKDWISPYFSANFSVTKEIGDLASISFYANNFFRNMGQVYSTARRQYSSIDTYVQSFYFGLTLRLKF